MIFRVLLPAILVGALSAGCTTVRVIDSAGGQNYYDGAFEIATKDGEIDTYIVGTPFSTPKPEFDNTVITTLYGSTLGQKVNFTPAKPNQKKYGFHVIIAFNAISPLSVADICEDARRIKTARNQSRVSMQAIFCQGAYPISYSSGYAGELKSPADPDFRNLVQQVALAMIPSYDDYKSSGFTPD